jgi:ppGpp synthetase/RelA/SpoT-type nucleotidyltranferase
MFIKNPHKNYFASNTKNGIWKRKQMSGSSLKKKLKDLSGSRTVSNFYEDIYRRLEKLVRH